MKIRNSARSHCTGSGGAKIDVWPYGVAVEILHVASYADETPILQKRMKFITDKGYVVAEPHEEYSRDSESWPKTADYQTIIRYQGKKSTISPALWGPRLSGRGSGSCASPWLCRGQRLPPADAAREGARIRGCS